MKFSIITPNFNGERYLRECMESVLSQRAPGVELEYIVIDGGSSDGSTGIINSYAEKLAYFISEKDSGPADAINKGLKRASGDIVGWINADDFYMPGALVRVADVMTQHPDKAICFGHCPIVNEAGCEIRRGITRFKEAFFPLSCRFAIQSINYISQPATFFRKSAMDKAGFLRKDFKAAWDYDFWLRLWQHGGAVRIRKPALAAFRWHASSISGQNYRRQFDEELRVAQEDAGSLSVQALLHLGVKWGIIASYSAMERRRTAKAAS
jgi:glycosyltransferase involved in cell wall biosynthesis